MGGRRWGRKKRSEKERSSRKAGERKKKERENPINQLRAQHLGKQLCENKQSYSTPSLALVQELQCKLPTPTFLTSADGSIVADTIWCTQHSFPIQLISNSLELNWK